MSMPPHSLPCSGVDSDDCSLTATFPELIGWHNLIVCSRYGQNKLTRFQHMFWHWETKTSPNLLQLVDTNFPSCRC